MQYGSGRGEMVRMRGVAVVAWLMLAVPAAAQTSPTGGTFMTGNRLLTLCDSRNIDEQARCLGYTTAVYDTALVSQEALGGPLIMCPPSGLTAGQVQDIGVKRLRDEPATRHLPASAIVHAALAAAFPCRPAR